MRNTLVVVLWLWAVAAEAGTVRAVRTIRSEGFTRLIVECSERLDYRVSRGEGPTPRFAVDFPGASLPEGGFRPLELEDGPARSLRAVRTERGVRLLIETRARASASTFALLDPFRLVIDVGAARPAATPTAAPEAVAAPAPPRRRPELRTATRPPAEIRAAGPRLKLMIDAGHGGHDPGARGVGGLWEKDVVLDIALRLAEKARREPRFDVRMTRAGDVFVPLEERTGRANTFDADLFVSIHANAATNPGLSGLETYYLNNTDDRATIRLAQMENGVAAGGAGQGADVAFILSDLVQSYKVEESIGLAEALQRSAVAGARRVRAELRDIGVKAGPFYVLVGAGMPAVLVEVSFLTNPDEGGALANPDYREALAEGLMRGLLRFVETRKESRTL